MNSFSPAIKWKEPLTKVEPHYLKGVVIMADVEFHAEAWEVHDVEDTDEADGSKLTYQCTRLGGDNMGDIVINEIVDGDGQTVSFDGKDYIFLISPFQR